MLTLRGFMFEHVYRNPRAKGEEAKAKRMLQELYRYYQARPEEMPEEYIQLLNKGERQERVVCDYIAGMTDQYSTEKFQELYVPKAWQT